MSNPQTSLFKPILLSASALVLVIVVSVAFWLYHSLVAPLEPRFLNETLETSRLEIEQKLRSKIEEGKAMAIAFANDRTIVDGLVTKEREPLVKKLSGIREHFSSQSKYKNIGVQVIDSDSNTLIKSWQKDSFGEAMRHSFLSEMLTNNQVSGGLGVGYQGFGVVAFSPVKQDGQRVGAVATFGGIFAVVAEMKQLGSDWVLLLDKSYLEGRYQSLPASMKDNNVISEKFILANNKWFDADTVSFVNQYKRKTAPEAVDVALINGKVLIDLPVYDEARKVAGRHIIVKDASELMRAIDHAKAQVYIILAIMVLVLVLMAAVILLMLRKKVILPLNELVLGIEQVVSNSHFDRVFPVAQMDELGRVYQATNVLLSNMNQALFEANQVVEAIAEGNLAKRITGHYVGDLDKLKQSINHSATNISQVMSSLSSSMSNLKAGLFSQKINVQAPGQYGEMLANAHEAMSALNAVISDINKVMIVMDEGEFGLRVQARAEGDLAQMKEHINSSMNNLASAMSEITRVVSMQASGDLMHECAGNFKGQLKTTQEALNTSVKKLRATVTQAIHTSDTVGQASAQVSQGSSDLSNRVQEQAAALEQTSATMNEMTSAVQANTANASKVAVLAHDVKDQAGAGVEVMQKTISAMQSIKASSSKIADIVTLIDGIAFQTNLLALNAAVEAARAGEHGRGFAVVAGEVRALAQKSASAAKDIKDLISDSVHRIDVGTQLADKSGEMLSGITGSIEQVAKMIEEIATASGEQSEGIAQVNLAIANIDRVTQENAALVEETTAAAYCLSQEAEHLREDMHFFKTEVTQGHSARKPSSIPSASRSMVAVAKGSNRALPSPSKSGNAEWNDF